MTKRILTLALILVFAVALIPATALAADTHRVYVRDMAETPHVDYGSNLEVEDGAAYQQQLTPHTGYKLVYIEVYYSDGTIMLPDDYTASVWDGTVSIKEGVIHSDIIISTMTAPETYEVEVDSPLSYTKSSEKAIYGQDYTVTFDTDNVDKMIKDVEVSVKGALIDNFTFDIFTGELTVSGDAVVGKIEIVADAEPRDEHIISVSGDNVFTEQVKAAEYMGCEVQITPMSHYDYPENITVTYESGWSFPDAYYSYDPGTGKVVFDDKAITDNITIDADCKPMVYSVDYDLVNLTTDAGDKATHGEDFDVILKPADGYFNAENVVVTMDGDETAFFVYDEETGLLSIDGYSIRGNIHINASAREPREFELYNRIDNSTLSTDAMTEGKEVAAYITPDAEFHYPESVELYRPYFGDNVPEELYTYDPETGKLVIDGSAIIADIDLIGKCMPYSFEVDCYREYVVFTGEDKAIYGEDYTCNAVPKQGYVYEKVQVLCDQTVWLVEGVDFKFDPETGDITVFASAVTGDLDIVVHTDFGEYDVTYNVTNITVRGNEKVTATHTYSYFLTPDEGYALSEDITVTVDGEELTKGVGYELETSNVHRYVLKINGEYLLGDVVITAKADYIPKVITVEYSLKNLKAENTGNGVEGEDYKTVLKPDEGYFLPASVTVRLNGKTVSPDAYKYNSETGELTVFASAFKDLNEDGNKLAITAEGAETPPNDGGEGDKEAAPLPNTPNTGDTAIAVVCVILMLAALCGIAFVCIKKRKIK